MMAATLPSSSRSARSLWRDVVQPKEHGSWSLALEPVALGLIAASSVCGGALAVAIVAGFLARRPLKLAVNERDAVRRGRARTALAGLAVVGAAALLAAGVATSPSLAFALAPAAIAGLVFLRFDLRHGGRDEPAELAGALAFASLPAALTIAAGRSPAVAVLLAGVMIARAVPTVLLVRARVRGAKSGRLDRRAILLPTAFVFAVATTLCARGALPLAILVALGALLIRAAIYAALPAATVRPRTLGFIELGLGAVYVATAGFACRF